jgi:hypothetical protein
LGSLFRITKYLFLYVMNALATRLVHKYHIADTGVMQATKVLFIWKLMFSLAFCIEVGAGLRFIVGYYGSLP